jgi:hypothetical protein
MGGDNKAVDPSTRKTDCADDLSLLTTRPSSSGAVLVTIGETSAETRQAARLHGPEFG